MAKLRSLDCPRRRCFRKCFSQHLSVLAKGRWGRGKGEGRGTSKEVIVVVQASSKERPSLGICKGSINGMLHIFHTAASAENDKTSWLRGTKWLGCQGLWSISAVDSSNSLESSTVKELEVWQDHVSQGVTDEDGREANSTYHPMLPRYQWPTSYPKVWQVISSSSQVLTSPWARPCHAFVLISLCLSSLKARKDLYMKNLVHLLEEFRLFLKGNGEPLKVLRSRVIQSHSWSAALEGMVGSIWGNVQQVLGVARLTFMTGIMTDNELRTDVRAEDLSQCSV